MQQITNNEFFEGLNSDTDDSKLKNTLLRKHLNRRLINKEGQGLVSVNIAGNMHQFSITPGYVPIGHCVYRGVAYIVSVNPLQGNIGEVGCYPSPKRQGPGLTLCDPLGGFEHVYKPLNNYTGAVNPSDALAVRQNFRTTRFNFKCEHPVRSMFAREDYDGSLNLYLSDFEEPVKVVNTGFNHTTGICNNRLYYDGSFPSQINFFNSTVGHGNINGYSVTTGGVLKAGNYYVYVRYSTADFNRSPFLIESGPFQIFSDSLTGFVETQGNSGNDTTDKAIRLTLSNYDPSYSFAELAYIRYYDDGLSEVMILNRQFALNADGTPVNLEVTGNESMNPEDISEIQKETFPADIIKSITDQDNRFWGGNVKSKDIYDPSLEQFALSVKAFAAIQYPEGYMRSDDFFAGQPIVEVQFKDYYKTHDRVGYFRGEAYPFGLVFVTKTGKHTKAFPCTGLDYRFTTQNNKGVVRFPHNVIPIHPNLPGYAVNMSVGFDLTNTPAFINSPQGQWIKDNIDGFYFVRGERNQNMIYQGICMASVNYDGLTGSGTVIATDNHMPMPSFASSPRYTLVQQALGFAYNTVLQLPATKKANHFGMFSHDFHIDQSIENGVTMHAEVMAEIDAAVPDWGVYTDAFHSYGDYYYWIHRHTQPSSWGTTPVTVYRVDPWTPAPNNNFVSYFPEGNTSNNNSLAYAGTPTLNVRNVAIGTGAYIGIVTHQSVNLENRLVSLYRTRPESITDVTTLFNIPTVEYAKIGEKISIDSLIGGSPQLFHYLYKGDCFVQRNAIKTHYHCKYYNDTLTTNTGSIFLKHGRVMSWVSENRHNVGMRRDSTTNTYYPKLSPGSPYDMALTNHELEAKLLNTGYDETLSIRRFYGHDANLPFQTIHYPTRVVYSNFHRFNSFTDFYRIVDVNAREDYDYRMGEITAIVPLGNTILCIQRHGLSNLIINERAVVTGTTSGDLLLGKGDILNPKVQLISDTYGSQHQLSILKTDTAVYGWDWNKRLQWRIQAGQGVEPLSETKAISRLVYQAIEQLGDHSDVIHEFADSPMCGNGISVGYDRKYQEVITSFIFDTNHPKPHPSRVTFVYNERMGFYTGQYTHHSPMYITLNEDFFSVDPSRVPSGTINNPYQSDFYIHDVKQVSGVDNYQTFYGILSLSQVSVVANAYSDLSKQFDAIEINSDGNPFDKILYDTLYQSALHDPFLQPAARYINPEYREDIWRLPIVRCTSLKAIAGNQYQTGSRMTGKTVQITVDYFSAAPNYIKSILTKFIISKQ